jgi:hypothetical protein
MSDKQSKRERLRAQRGRRRLGRTLIWAAVGLVVVGGVGALFWQGSRPRPGEEIPVMADTAHVAQDTDPGQYNSDPPTSGPHYGDELDAGFYETNPYSFPAGYLVHNLEHGYIIINYNCALLDEGACNTLKTDIRDAMNDIGEFKLIAYPWDTIDVPVVLTSWGRMQRMPEFDAGQLRAYYRANLNRAPEPNAP